MSKLFAISLSFIILIQSFGIRVADVAQLDDFVEHAQFHNEQYGDTIFVFIAKHYGELKSDHEKEHQEEKEDHEQLPFKHQSHLSVVADFIINTTKEESKTLIFFDFRKHNFYYHEASSSQHLEGLLQPPQLS